MTESSGSKWLHEAALNAKGAQDSIDALLGANETPSTKNLRVEDVEGIGSAAIRAALERVSPELARSYDQILEDIADRSRKSWAGTAHEIRETLAALLRYMASDEEVQAQAWYIQNSNTNGPTQKQRVRYILETQSPSSKRANVVKEVSVLEDRIGRLVRATYARASDAAHRFKGRREVIRILRYFEVFARDLMDLD